MPATVHVSLAADITCQHSLPKTGPSYRQQLTVAMHKRDVVGCFCIFSITKPSSYLIQQTETKLSQSNGFNTVTIPVLILYFGNYDQDQNEML